MRIKIISGTDNVTLRSEENHREYASRHDYEYEFDKAPYPDLPSPYFRKLRSVVGALDGNDWVFWIDDDAFFTNMSAPLEGFLHGVPDDVFLVICASPVNLQGGWTFISSGQFLIRNSANSRKFLHQVLCTPVETARKWWDESRYGMFTGGDQDSIVYVLVTENLLEKTRILPYQAFNARPYHFKDKIDEFFLVHFPGIKDKHLAIAEFGARFGLDETLAPRGDITTPTKTSSGASERSSLARLKGIFDLGRFLRLLRQ